MGSSKLTKRCLRREQQKKKIIMSSSNNKKKNPHTHFFAVHFFAVVLHDNNVNFLVTRSMEEISHGFPFALFSLPLIFTTCVCLLIHLQMDGISYRVLSLFYVLVKGKK